MKYKVGLLGFGKTGSLVAQEIIRDPNLELSWVARRQVGPTKWASRAIGIEEDFAPFFESKDLNKDFFEKNKVDLVIDFSTGKSAHNYQNIGASGAKIVSAISKFTNEELELVKKAGATTAILASPNITLGINWLLIASKLLKRMIPHADIEIVEEHFRAKKEVSGTALKLAEQLELPAQERVNSIRVGGIVGKHEVIFGLPYQTIRLTHESVSRSAFGTGAIFGAKWLLKKEKGLFQMEHMFYEEFTQHMDEIIQN